jgi:hypothetical protein
MLARLNQWTALLTILVMVAGRASAIEPIRAGQESFISRAIFVNSRLWLLTDGGGLSSIAEGSDRQVNIPLSEPAFDLWIQDGDPAVLTGDRQDGRNWTVRKWSQGAWIDIARVATEGEQFVGAGSAAGAITLLTSGRLIDIVGGVPRSVSVAWLGEQRFAGISSMVVTRDTVFVGFNIGEWGGGLRRINRRNGHVSTVEENPSGKLCAGLLNTECDPVTGIAAGPGKLGCVAVAIGLVHMMARGSIVEVCGRAVKRLYVKPYQDEAPYSTMPFFGIVSAESKLWAVGIDGIYQLDEGRITQFTALPKFEQIGNASVSFALPHMVLVLTDVNRRRSVSGHVPMMVLR